MHFILYHICNMASASAEYHTIGMGEASQQNQEGGRFTMLSTTISKRGATPVVLILRHRTQPKTSNLNPFNMTIVQQGQGCPIQCARCCQAEEWRKQDISRELWATRFASTLQRFPTLQALWPRRQSSMAYPDFDPISPASSNASSPTPTPSGSRRRDAKNGQESKCT